MSDEKKPREAGPPVDLLAFGHSHLGALQRAYRSRIEEGVPVSSAVHFIRLNEKMFVPNFRTEGSDVYITADLNKRINFNIFKHSPQRILLLVMGNRYNSIALLRDERPFDFYWPEMDFEDCNWDVEPTIIPFDLIRAEMKRILDQEALLFFESVRSSTDRRVFVMPPAPPIADEEHILSSSKDISALARRQGVSPAPFRLKMYTLYCKLYREAIEAKGSIWIEPPHEVLDEGYLARSYWSQDPTHANARYGALMLDRVLSHPAGRADEGAAEPEGEEA